MHEIAIVREIFETLQKSHADKFFRIIKVQVEAGLLSNVQPILIQNAFEALITEEPRLAEIDLEVVVLPIVAYCDNCNKEFEVKKNRFICRCGRPSRKVVQGEELRVSKIEYLTDKTNSDE